MVLEFTKYFVRSSYLEIDRPFGDIPGVNKRQRYEDKKEGFL